MRDRIVLTDDQYCEMVNRLRADVKDPYFTAYIYSPLPHIDVTILGKEGQNFTLRYDYEKPILKIDGDSFSITAKVTANTEEERKQGRDVLLEPIKVDCQNKSFEQILAIDYRESKIWCYLCSIWLTINDYVLIFGNRTLEVEEKIAKKSETKHKQKNMKRDGDKVRLYKCYTLTKSWKRMKPLKKPEITCPAWGVRGHFRTYKTGKSVWINSYVKGKDRANYKGKEYVLLPKSNKKVSEG